MYLESNNRPKFELSCYCSQDKILSEKGRKMAQTVRNSSTRVLSGGSMTRREQTVPMLEFNLKKTTFRGG
jgi:hypothetical protein